MNVRHYIVYLDDFGHIGPYISKTDLHHKTSPIFGLAGLILPVREARPFATWFFKLKCNLLGFEISRDGEHPAKWEKKGSALYTTKNIERYPELRQATNRILNKIYWGHGKLFYVGTKKTYGVAGHNSEALFLSTLREAIKRLNAFCERRNASFQIVIDQTSETFRNSAVEAAGIAMFGDLHATRLIEPPMQVESHLYQTLQCADWICGLIGRYGCYITEPKEFSEFEWAKRYFEHRIKTASTRSGIRIMK